MEKLWDRRTLFSPHHEYVDSAESPGARMATILACHPEYRGRGEVSGEHASNLSF